MNTHTHLESELAQFIGAEHLYRLTRRHLMTDGVKYLCDKAKCYWLMDAVASHLSWTYEDHFAVARLVVTNQCASLTLDDGNDHIFASQLIPFTDFPLTTIKLYCCFDEDHWTIMLPTEY